MLIRDPLSTSDSLFPIQSVLRRITAQEGHDGDIWDVMQAAADYIDQLELELSEYKLIA